MKATLKKTLAAALSVVLPATGYAQSPNDRQDAAKGLCLDQRPAVERLFEACFDPIPNPKVVEDVCQLQGGRDNWVTTHVRNGMVVDGSCLWFSISHTKEKVAIQLNREIELNILGENTGFSFK